MVSSTATNDDNEGAEAVGPAILDAARRVIDAHGYAGFTQERIVAEAGISRVTFHRRGLGKEMLFKALVEKAIKRHLDAQWAVLASEESGADRLRLGLQVTCETAEEDLPLMLAIRAQIDELYHREEDGEAVPRREVITPIQVMIREGVADGSLREVDPKEASAVLTNAVAWTYVHLRTVFRWEPERARDATIEGALRGLLAAGPT